MAREDWYRNTEWNESIAEAFELKLKRARDKNQYLRIQACILARTHPRVALDLLDRYFALGEHSDAALAHVHRATAYLALEDLNAAIASYEAAIERENAFPNMRTLASIDLPYLIAMNGISSRFDQAMAILSSRVGPMAFPVERFKHHAARADSSRIRQGGGFERGANGHGSCIARPLWIPLSPEAWLGIREIRDSTIETAGFLQRVIPDAATSCVFA